MKVNNYIEKINSELKPNQNIEYESLYSSFKNVKLQEIFSTLHHLLISNYKKMNTRLPTGDKTEYFWAESSRELILAIETIQGLERALSNSLYNFNVEAYYNRINKEVLEFLSPSMGSIIPRNMDKIEIIDAKSIFKLQDSVELRSELSSVNVQLKKIGSGSYATVLKYKDPLYEKNFVVKRAKSNLNEKEIARFVLEFETMRQLKSPYIVEVYRYNHDKNEYYMEYMDTTLNDYINKNNTKLSLNIRKNIVRQTLRAFEYIYSKGFLHRDISPKNILIKKYDDVNVVKISDFGLVKIPDSELTSWNTDFKGYFNDHSLQTEGFNNYTIQHETFALTRVILFVMTGRVNINNIDNEDLKSLVEKGLNQDKGKRFQSIEELTRFFNSLSFDE
ncbi:hypothetical protein GCM10007358_14030 [Phocicoccus schoeneichii]|uniref:mitogen-activated protein kinase kinase n=1 Tax=Phocicoccus schoeneichii TaxID=1812261 RepID=A0A6V7R1W8_9BACL|nr:protein kinase family protein [Jeotgalicoccus schoeneichii]GGH54056.1 hypothetical protein GCM10007358_14030 [Jeotgalicoccus schoeneichii]CAD2071034.1 Serine/threonine-protein kinase PknD [Jeotgalicoccus schoeneichii]